MIIGISGRIGVGKDTLGEMIQKLIKGSEIKSYADKLRTVAEVLTGIPAEKFKDRNFKNSKMPIEWGWYGDEEDPMTVREFLQELGTDAIRDSLNPNAWINALMSDYVCEELNEGETCIYPNWIITDVRFPNEAEAIKKVGGIVIRLNRKAAAKNSHDSELAMEGWGDYNYTFDNDGDLEDLQAFANQVVNNLNNKENEQM